MAETPVFTSLDPQQLELLAEYIGQLRSDNKRIAAQEAARLEPYLEALGEILASDQKEAKDENPEITDQLQPGALSKLFNRVAASTKNTILSGLVIAPVKIFETPEALKGTTQFSALSNYNSRMFRFGFIQTFEDNKNGSTSIPILAFDNDLMEIVASFKPEAMLKALQTVATSSNHDMQHHYTSTILNTNIAKTAKDDKLPAVEFTVKDWGDLYFSKASKDSDPKSYEGWLMLNHARVRRLMETGPEGDALKESCDTFFAELKRIGAEITAAASVKTAHETVDYFGTMMIFAMSRSMPLDHPLMDYAIRSLQQADPDAEAIKKQKEEILWRIECPVSEGDYAERTTYNYRAKGIELVRKEQDYVSLKKLQLINIEPWVAHLMSTGQSGTELGEAQQRVGEVNREMVGASALTSWFNAVDGFHTTTRLDGTTLETYYKDGQLHRADGPAIILKDKAGEIIGEQWFQNGKRYRADGGPQILKVEGTGTQRTATREWLDEEGRVRHTLKTCPDTIFKADAYREFWDDENGKRHREDGPALLVKDVAGNVVEEEWKQHGIPHREGGPAITTVDAKGLRVEIWYSHGTLHNDNGPARIETAADGTRRKEIWIQNGGMHREGAPANITVSPNGMRTEEWYKHGQLHNENGPAYVRIKPDGTRKEEYYLNGLKYPEPQQIATKTKPLAFSKINH